jgi:ubiquinone/menaquinone biosynthesis C-methylase UbiE
VNVSRASTTPYARRQSRFSELRASAGARVLECGSGGGDVSILVGELVTPTGAVLGIEREPANVEAAARRVEQLGMSHIRFEVGDIGAPPDESFDAVVGRLVLMYQPDIAAVLRALADSLAPRGVMAFLEYEHVPASEVVMWPRSPTVDRLFRWTDDAFHALGFQERMGTRLPSLMRSVGLEAQAPYVLTGAVYSGDAVAEHVTTLIKGLAGVLTAQGIATEAEIDIETFGERVRAECGPDPVLVSGPDLAVWARKL